MYKYDPAKYAKYYKENKNRLLEVKKAYYENNTEIIKARVLARAKANPELVRATKKLYKLRRNKQMPLWADASEIKRIYRECPIEHHVDHIIPLKGNNVCGLHVENNLQYLTQKQNLKKSNHFSDSENNICQ